MTNSTSSTQFTRFLANALKLTLENPNEKWEPDKMSIKVNANWQIKQTELRKTHTMIQGYPFTTKTSTIGIQWEQASILEIECDTNRRRLLEAIHIYKNKD